LLCLKDFPILPGVFALCGNIVIVITITKLFDTVWNQTRGSYWEILPNMFFKFSRTPWLHWASC